VSTRNSDAAAISSQASRNVVTDPAAGTRIMAATKNGSMTMGKRAQCSRFAYPIA